MILRFIESEQNLLKNQLKTEKVSIFIKTIIVISC